MATHKQLRTIWMAARQLDLREQELRDIVEDLSGQRSLSALSPKAVRELIDHLVRLGAEIDRPSDGARAEKPSGRRLGTGVVKLITGEQQEMIQDLRARLGGDWERDRYFEGACMRLIKRPRPRTGAEAARVIEMLKRRIHYNTTRTSRR